MNRIPALITTLVTALTTPAALAQLTPPPGPVQDTNRVRAEADARTAINTQNTPGTPTATFRITQPGSYYLEAPLNADIDKHGIEIAASDVTIDLNGFAITGASFFGTSLSGITANQPEFRTGITIINGNIRGFAQSGINLPLVTGVRLENISAFNNTATGIAAGENAVLTACVARSNGATGIIAGLTSQLERCIADDNGGGPGITFPNNAGFRVQVGSILERCSATGNAGSGLDVPFLQGTPGLRVVVNRCTMSNNGSAGASIAASAVVTWSSFGSNAAVGLFLQLPSVVRDCSANNNGGQGFGSLGQGSFFLNCTADTNGQEGFLSNGGGLIENCNARRNRLDGIKMTSTGVIRECLAENNGFTSPTGAGISVTASVRIENNQCLSNDFGIITGTGSNILIGNICGSNSSANYFVAAGNAALIVPLTDNSPEIAGNAGGTGLGSTNPYANFAY